MATSVEIFMEVVPQLITEAAEYAGSGVSNASADANIRQLRTMTAALQSALMAVPLPVFPTLASPAAPATSPSKA